MIAQGLRGTHVRRSEAGKWGANEGHRLEMGTTKYILVNPKNAGLFFGGVWETREWLCLLVLIDA